MSRLRAALKVQPGESRLVALLAGLLLCTAAGNAVGGSATDAIFFARFGVQYLPYLYMALGAVTSLVSLGLMILLGRMPRARLYQVLPLALAGALVGARFLAGLDLKWFYPILWLVPSVFRLVQTPFTWGLASALVDTRQAKRLFPLLAAGSILGGVVGGLGTRPLVAWLHTENLLLIWAGTLVVAFLLCRALLREAARDTVRRSPNRASSAEVPRDGVREVLRELQQGYHVVRRTPMLRWMAGAAVLFSVLYFSLTLPFARAATAQFHHEDALAGFLGTVQGASTAAAFLASLLLANRLFARVGIMTAILVFPVIYLAGFSALAIDAIFLVLVVFRFVQLCWLQGVADAAYQATFNVVPSGQRDQTRAFIDGVPGQLGIIIAGVMLLIGEEALPPRALYMIGLGAAALTIWLVWQARGAYRGALVAALRASQPQVFFAEKEPLGGFRRDAAAVTAAVTGLADAKPVMRRVAAEVLGHLAVPQATKALAEALTDPDTGVRAAVLPALARAHALAALPQIARCLGDPEASVRWQAVDALDRLAGRNVDAVASVQPLLGDPAPAVRAHAAATLLRRGASEKAQQTLADMASGEDAEARMSALSVLGEWGDGTAFEWATVGVSDPDAAVRRAAAVALAHIDPRRAVAPLVRALRDGDRLVQEAVAGALGGIGASALGPTLSALADPASEEGALAALRHLPVAGVAPEIQRYARDAASQALRYHALWCGIAPSDGDTRVRLVADSLRALAQRHALHALRATGLLGDRDAIAVATDNLKSRDPRQRANALETLEALGDTEVIRPLLRLWERSDAAPMAPEGTLLRLLEDTDGWLRACAARAARESADTRVRAALARLAASDPDPLVREAVSGTRQGASAMETLSTLSTMERILFLRRVPLFSDLAPADLKHVAALATERRYPDGATIVRQGDPGDDLYIVVSGEVRVLVATDTQSQVEVARCQAGEYAGEMAIISQEPRVASLVAAGDVRTLCIGQQPFEGILRERPETSLAVMRVLCMRLREIQDRLRPGA
jgi:HEAT repeat protein